jgi:hypothetical protein
VLHSAQGGMRVYFLGFPKIDYMSIPDMQKYFGGEVLNINDPHSGERRAGLKTEVQSLT